VEQKDMRRSRAAALNMIPTTTGASKLIGKLLPNLDGKVQALAVRVPVPTVSLIDLVFTSKTKLTTVKLHNAFKCAAQGSMKGILDISMDPLVSSDYMKNPHSVIVDGLSTQIYKDSAKILGWYDNEWGYSERLKDFLLYVNRKK
jgi:glyceraldehyde 3-phosphate dehydrogenase